MQDILTHLVKHGIQYTFVTTLVDQPPEEYAATIDLACSLGARAHKTNALVPQGRGVTVCRSGDRRARSAAYVACWKAKRAQYLGKMGVLAETMFQFEIGLDSPEFRNYQILDVGCPAALLTCGIKENGDVTPCSFFSGASAGNILRQPFSEIWNSSPLFQGFRASCPHFECRASGRPQGQDPPAAR